MVAVVGHEGGTDPAVLEQLVPVHGRQAATDLELAPRVEHLDPGDGRRKLEPSGSGSRPVRVGEIRDASRARDPVTGLGEVAALPLELGRVAIDPDAEHVPVAVAGQDAVELDPREHHELGARRSLAAVPVVGDREDVVPGAPVVARERPGRQLAVRVGRVRVQRGPQPVSVALPGRVHVESLLQWRRSGPYDRRTRHTTRGDARGRFPGAGVRVPPPARRGTVRPRQAAQAGSCDRGRPHRHLVARGRPCGAGEGARRPAAPRDQAEPVRARRGGQEGRPPERDRAAARLGELRRDHLDLHEEVRHRHHERQPQRLLVGREPGDRLAQGRPSRTRRRRRQPHVRGRRHRRGPVRAGTTSAPTRPSRGR